MMRSLEDEDRDVESYEYINRILTEGPAGSPSNISTGGCSTLLASTSTSATPMQSQLQQRYLSRARPTIGQHDHENNIEIHPQVQHWRLVQQREQQQQMRLANEEQPHADFSAATFEFSQHQRMQYSAVANAWPPRSYSCSFCHRDFNSAQALGGHMNVHRRDRARLRHSGICNPSSHSATAAFDFYSATASASTSDKDALSSDSPAAGEAAEAVASITIYVDGVQQRQLEDPQLPHTSTTSIDDVAETGGGPFLVATPAAAAASANSVGAGSYKGNMATDITIRSAGQSEFDVTAYDHSGQSIRARGAASHPPSMVHASDSSSTISGVLDLELRLGRSSVLNDDDGNNKK